MVLKLLDNSWLAAETPKQINIHRQVFFFQSAVVIPEKKT